MNKTPLLLAALAAFFLLIDNVDASTVIYPAPAGASLSSDYSVKVDGQPVSVYRGVGRTGYGGNYSFAYFDFSGTVNVEITTSKALGNLAIRPESKGIVHAVSGDKITFSLSEPCSISIEPDGRNGPLLLFANPLEVNPPHQGDPGVIYYGPGMHNVGQINVAGGQTLYIAGGAVINGWIRVNGSPETGEGNQGTISDVRITGRGIVDSVNWGTDAYTQTPVLQIYNAKNVTVDGIILKDSRTWSFKMEKCDSVKIDNVKILATQAEMRDGFSFNNAKNITVQDSFVRCDDDAISTYGLPWNSNMPVDTISIKRTVLWSDRANIWRLGLISEAEYVGNLTFTGIDVLHMDIRGVEWCIQLVPAHGRLMSNIRFENIRINNEANNKLIKLKPEVGAWHPYSYEPPGKVQNVYFKDITFSGSQSGIIQIYGPAADQYVNDVTFENVMRGGVLTTRNSPGVSVSGYANNINFIAADTVLPTISSVSANNRTRVDVTFSEPVEQATAQAMGNYNINNGISITSAVLGEDLKTVTLTTSALTQGVTYTLTVNNVKDRASPANTIASNSQKTFLYVGQTPYGGVAWPIPGTIQTEDYDSGEEGTAYHDTTSGNAGSSYRSDGVDIYPNLDSSYVIGYTQAGEWLEYTVNVASSGTYTIEARVSSIDSYGKFHIEINGTDVTGQFTMPAYGGSLVWSTMSKAGVSLAAGQHIMRISLDNNGNGNLEVANLNWVRFNQSGSCIHKSDSSCDGCVDTAELSAFINRWQVNNQDVTLKEIIEAMGFWKRGCP